MILAYPAQLTLTTKHVWRMENGNLKERIDESGCKDCCSLVTVFIVASILFFIVGFLCGHFRQKKRKSSIYSITADR